MYQMTRYVVVHVYQMTHSSVVFQTHRAPADPTCVVVPLVLSRNAVKPAAPARLASAAEDVNTTVDAPLPSAKVL